MKLRRLSTAAPGFAAALAELTRYEAAQDEAVEATVRDIIAQVRAQGDAAVLELTRRFDRVEARAIAELEVPQGALEAALAALPEAEGRAKGQLKPWGFHPGAFSS